MKQRSIGAQGYTGSLSSPSPWAALALTAAVMLGSSCKKESPPPTPPAAPPAATPTPTPAAVTQAKPTPPPAPAAKPLEWDDPPQWKKKTPSSAMRRASYEIPPAKGDKNPGELNVFILGGEIEPNIKRWVDEFSGFDPKTLVRHDRTVNDMTQAVVEVPNGTFSGGMGSPGASANYGLLGAIVVTPSGAEYFFKLTGPSATVKAARDPFYKMLDGMRLEGGTPEKPGLAAEKKAGTAPAAKPTAGATGSTTSTSAPAAATPTPAAPAAHAAAAHTAAAPAAKK
jgi:hypothetical protein